MVEVELLRDRIDGPVELVAWPSEQRRRAALARAGIARLLLVEPGVEPPADLAADEDWLRLPADERDVRRRADQVAEAVRRLDAERPYIDEHRILHRGPMAVPLTATAAAILSALLERRGTTVSVDELQVVAWHGAAPSRDAVHAAVARLRRRIAGLHLVVRSVRQDGFVLDET